MKRINKVVSLIVPVYNADKYLRNCIDSILNQTYKDIELILINDGSTDSSGFICDEYKKRDKRVRVIHQNNSGPSTSRNSGINATSGDYIQFVDSDDSLEKTMVAILVRAMQGNDLVISGFNLYDFNKKSINFSKKTPPLIGTFEKIGFLKGFGIFYTQDFINPLWNKLYDNRIISKYKIKFKEDVYRGEDLLFNLQYLTECNTINVVNNQLYNYSIFNNNSITGSFQRDLLENQKILYFKTIEFLKKHECFSNENEFYLFKSYKDSMYNCLENLFHLKSSFTTKEKKHIILKIAQDRWLREGLIVNKRQTLQGRIVDYLIKNENTTGIYFYFKIKNFLRHNMEFVFNFIKRYK